MIETRDYMGKLETPVYGTLSGITSDGTCIVELADGSTVYADHPEVETTEVYAKIITERENRELVAVTAHGLASDDGKSYDWYEN